MGSEEFRSRLNKLQTTDNVFGEFNKDLAILSSDKITRLNA
jgi:hypothetical protein